MNRAVAVVGVVMLAVGAAAIGAALRPALPSEGVSAAATPVEPASTATVTRRTMRATEELDGALGYSGEGVIIGGLSGTYTKLPAVGDILALGDEIYEVDGADSSYLMYGDRPAWRPLSRDTSNGADVRQLEEGLKGLGVLDEDVETDRHYGANTARAVRSWERRTDQPRDGEIDAGQVTFLPGAVRITEVVPELGTTAQRGSVVARTSGTDLVVTLDLDAERRGIADVGDQVSVEMPDGSATAGLVADIDSVARTIEGGSEPTVEVTVELAEDAAAGDLDGAEVTVSIVRETRPDVLSVPVDALLALREGGYALELVDADGGTHLVAVQVGLFDDDGVEVRGDVEAGDSVVVPG